MEITLKLADLIDWFEFIFVAKIITNLIMGAIMLPLAVIGTITLGCIATGLLLLALAAFVCAWCLPAVALEHFNVVSTEASYKIAAWYTAIAVIALIAYGVWSLFQ